MEFYSINGDRLPLEDVSRIIVYGDGKKLFTCDQGQIEDYTIRENKYGHESVEKEYCGGPEVIVLKNPVKRANKENLDRKDNYTLKYTPDYCTWETRKALYIHESEISVTDIGEITAMETDEERNYLSCRVLTFNNPVTFRRLHCEKIPCGNDWRIPDGGQWKDHGWGPENAPYYKPYDNSKSMFAKKRGLDPEEKGVIKSWYTFETIERGAEIVAAERYYTKTEYSAERIRKNNLAAAFNKVYPNMSFSHYDIDKLEKVFNITLKEEE